jgi:hypothetical protein
LVGNVTSGRFLSQRLLLILQLIILILIYDSNTVRIKIIEEIIAFPIIALPRYAKVKNQYHDTIRTYPLLQQRAKSLLLNFDTQKGEIPLPITTGDDNNYIPTTSTVIDADDDEEEEDMTYQSLQHKSASSIIPSSLSSSSTEGLSKFHRSILRRSGMDRQRFVTGRYPIVLSFRKNPTRKWLNIRTTNLPSSTNRLKKNDKPNYNMKHIMAETEVYVNGTLASQSLASLDRLYWYDDHERRILQQDYSMISMELLAEIHVDRPGYVNIMSSRGGGRRAAMSHKIRQQQLQNGNRWTIQAMNLLKSYNEGHSKLLSNYYSQSTASLIRPQQDNQHSRFIEMIEGLTSTTTTDEDRLWVTGFTLTGRQGSITAIDCEQCLIQPLNERSKSTMLWPNEVQEVPSNLLNHENNQHVKSKSNSSPQHPLTSEWMSPYQDAILVCDGFLVPTKDRGGIYIVKNPGHETEWTLSLTKPGDRWFYHRAVWIDITGDGRQSILTARCQVSTVLDTRTNGDGIVTSGVTKSGQLVWLECPQPARFDPITGTPLEHDGTMFDPFNTRHLPWKEHILTTGPDVMFAIADLDTSDDTVEVLASEFFNKQVTLTSIQCAAAPKVVFKKVIDDQSGQAFGCILSSLNTTTNSVETYRSVVDAGSTVNCLHSGNYFSHLLVTSHECKYDDNSDEIAEKGIVEEKPTSNIHVNNNSAALSKNPEGGSLFAYRVPNGKNAWRTQPWQRSLVSSGFKVRDKLNNMINPGAPGFVYTFYAHRNDAKEMMKRPLIAVAGDCAESAFIFRPSFEESTDLTAIDNDISTSYTLMAEIQCDATVGSIGIGYNDFSSVEQESGYAKLYIPCFETDKIMVFGLGSGEDDDVENTW